MKQCVKCGHELADEAVFCHICGEKQIHNDNNSENISHVDNQTPQPVKVEKKKNDIGLGNTIKLIAASICLILFGIMLSFVYRVYSEQKRSEEIKQNPQNERMESLEITEKTATTEKTTTDKTTTVKKTTVKKRKTLEWSKKSKNRIKWQEAVDYCKNLSENGHSDWRLPTIDEWRSTFQNCPETQPGGTCQVSEKKRRLDPSAFSRECKAGCRKGHSTQTGRGWFWSSSGKRGTNHYWVVALKNARISSLADNGKGNVFCVR